MQVQKKKQLRRRKSRAAQHLLNRKVFEFQWQHPIDHALMISGSLPRPPTWYEFSERKRKEEKREKTSSAHLWQIHQVLRLTGPWSWGPCLRRVEGHDDLFGHIYEYVSDQLNTSCQYMMEWLTEKYLIKVDMDLSPSDEGDYGIPCLVI